MSKVLGLGNALVDIMTKLNDDSTLDLLGLPKGSMQLVDEIFMQKAVEHTKHIPQTLAAGGSAANTIHGLANLGVSTAFIGKIGNDTFGSAFESDMRKNSINPIMLKGNAESGRALALVSPDSERTFAVYLGAAIEMTAEDLKPEMFDGYSYFHIEGYLVQNQDLIRSAVEIAHRKGLKISLDLASYNVVEDNRDFLKEIILKYVDIVFANEEESKAFTGKSPEESLEIIGSITSVAVVKLGSAGSLIKSGDETVNVGIINVDCIDTTGAGDLYASGFLYGLIKNLPLYKCGQIGAVLSGHVIEVLGPKMDGKRWDNVKKLVEEIENE
ncbi:MAG TPA: adenosine kinase [Tenuifilaceae bacterium]|nr:adenosine kinase [Tenuifilaceae bacterium]HPI45069.1 adenosine kinase [Tenuifilaceae bacterium]HPN21126.1 adenosine kinase [Tenuifilaceae bacterium]